MRGLKRDYVGVVLLRRNLMYRRVHKGLID